MTNARLGFGALLLVAGVAACAPTLAPPRESVRLSGTLEDVIDPPPSTTAAAPAATAAPQATPGKVPTPKPLATYPVLRHSPLGVAVYEACSSQLYVFKRCPGRFLGEAKLAKPGPFVVEIDTQATEIVLFGFRGFLGPEQQQEACAETKIAVADAAKQPIALKLETGTCSIKLDRRYG